MAQAMKIIQAFKVKAALGRLARAKENALRAMAGLPPIRPWYEDCYISCMRGLKQMCCKAFCPCCIKPSRPRLKKIPVSCCGRMFTADTYENECLKNFLGFFSGIAMSFLVYLLMALQMNLPLLTSTIISSSLGLVLSLGLAFSETFRCVVLLMLPSFCSSRGRSFLLMYATILILNHPVTNFNHNILVMSESATCGQSLALNETRKLLEEAMSPVAALIDGIRDMLRAIRRFAETIRQAFLALKRAIQEIGEAIGRVLDWLKSIVSICNHNMGAPYRRCRKSFDEAIQDCRNRLGVFKFICEVVDWVANVCHIARAGELFCLVTSEIAHHVGRTIGKPVTKILDSIHDMFYFNITIDYHYSLHMNQSKSYEQIKEEIMEEIKGTLNRLVDLINVADHVMTFMVTFVVIKAVMYRYKYIHKSHFDNVFITAHVHRIDERRQELGRETIFPLMPDENTKYGRASSPRLLRSEKMKMAKGIVFWTFAASHGCYYLMCDYGLYWVLSLIRTHFEVKTNSAIPPHTKLHVQGEGAMADMYRALISVLDPVSDVYLDVDTSHCLPNPAVPNFAIYEIVAIIYGVCFFLSVSEAYALRLRHVIAACYHPGREEQRAVWLYNHILKTRGGFLKFARRQIRRKYMQDQDVQKASFRSRLAAQYPLFRKLLKFLGYERKMCLLCGKEGKKNDEENFLDCVSSGCEAVYCINCFDDLQNMCTACMNPVDYGDLSDVSEEMDSSEDEEEIERKKKDALERKERQAQRREERRASRMLLSFKETLKVSSTVDISESTDSSSSSSDGSYTSSSDDEDYHYQYQKTGSDLEESDSDQSKPSTRGRSLKA
ncbi:DC-STAMP domain-containing protein 2-like [Haliotis rubra]|uniref:DC-STAMP domain-containing protein 2-like n=1 Tax=Haliotis rubra TaxID=36100 RepID=UPI001EE59021|nr:DC-STAMP domain-containing protein 2-like [Haliotis rubra]